MDTIKSAAIVIALNTGCRVKERFMLAGTGITNVTETYGTFKSSGEQSYFIKKRDIRDWPKLRKLLEYCKQDYIMHISNDGAVQFASKYNNYGVDNMTACSGFMKQVEWHEIEGRDYTWNCEDNTFWVIE